MNNTTPLNLPYGTYILSYDLKSQIGDNARVRVYLADGTSKDTYTDSTGDFVHIKTPITGAILSWGINYGDIPRTGELAIKKLQLEVGNIETTPEEFTKPITLFLDENGKAKTKSLSPYMTFVPSVNGAQITADYHKSWGMRTEYDSFWDIYQQNGEREIYQNAFSYGWNDSNFKPKYNIVPKGDNGCGSMFFKTNIVDLAECMKKANVVFDTSQATRLSSVFDRMDVTLTVPTVNAINTTIMNMTYYNSSRLKKIVIKNIQPSCTFDRVFNYVSALETLELINCIIGQNGFNVQWSTKLSHDSLTSIVNALSTTTSGLTVTLSKTAVNTAFETSVGAGDGSTSSEWLNLIATRNNWTISLV